MNKIKKLTAVLLSMAVMLCMLAVPASAKSIFDDAVTIKTMETVSHTFKNDTEVYYKINLPDSGKITFYCTDYSGRIDWKWFNTSSGPYLSILDSYGNTILDRRELANNVNIPKEVPKKGIYYLKFEKVELDETSFKNFYFGFQPDNTPKISLQLNAKVGDTFDFSALAANYSGKVTWKSTKTAVATVEKGKIAAKKAGKAKIRAYMDNGDYAELTIKVTK